MKGKAAKDCTPEEIKAEVWEQLKQGLNYGDVTILRDEQIHSWSLDPSIRREEGTTANEEPLLVNLVDTWKLRPEALSRRSPICSGLRLRPDLYRISRRWKRPMRPRAER